MRENGFKETEIGLIPEDWEVVRLGEILQEVDIKVKDVNNKINLEVFSLTKEFGLIPQTERFKKRVAVEDISNYKVVKKWWIVYNPYVIWEGAICALRKAEIVAVSPVYCVWKCKNADPSFIDRLLRTSKLLNEYLARASGVVNRRRSVSKDDFLNIKIPLPPLSEQQKIAKVLDKIQQAIELQDRIIELLKNLKKSLMQKLFTEGLYGEEQKETEIGLIPKSWEVVRLGEVAHIKLGSTPERKEKKYWENGSIPWVKIQDLNNSVIYDTSEKISDIAFKEKFKGKFVPKGTLLLSFKLSIGKVGILGIDAVHHEGIASLFLKEEIVSKKFLFYLLQSLNYENLLDTYVKGKTLNKEKLKILPIPLPPLEEQKQIAHILSTVDKKIEVEQRRKEVLKELFKTMLHKLMSGEIRLKEVEI